jgi:hypothetical protein
VLHTPKTRPRATSSTNGIRKQVQSYPLRDIDDDDVDVGESTDRTTRVDTAKARGLCNVGESMSNRAQEAGNVREEFQRRADRKRAGDLTGSALTSSDD